MGNRLPLFEGLLSLCFRTAESEILLVLAIADLCSSKPPEGTSWNPSKLLG
jgi:hypothetical protein